MEIKTKFNEGDYAFLMRHDKVLRIKVEKIHIKVSRGLTKINYDLFSHTLQMHDVTENGLYKTKQELLDSL